MTAKGAPPPDGDVGSALVGAVAIVGAVCGIISVLHMIPSGLGPPAVIGWAMIGAIAGLGIGMLAFIVVLFIWVEVCDMLDR